MLIRSPSGMQWYIHNSCRSVVVQRSRCNALLHVHLYFFEATKFMGMGRKCASQSHAQPALGFQS